ncbi:DNA cytosine methyltransferase [Companilactobacillus suantsaicola]|uniref:DNA (cytosine-5-)-methyltransferase n=1 Tax=Companilactobacillus suantsaicola TaxID=2487723 RepID=A0A4Z0JGA6_9LACO|nr:DNA cytosine methyltransferase [Companilactobacillus suantsaicola]TGD21952.1 DNA cytosine methyltransferase [Companilactobacillus suantsaicola]
MKLKIIDLFSGAGGLTEGFRNSNFKIIKHVEMDESASETLRLRDIYYYLKRNKKSKLYYEFLNDNLSVDDLNSNIPKRILDNTINEEINERNLEYIFKEIDTSVNGKISGVIGGPPCQAYSTIGRARNAYKKKTDKRIYLYRYYIAFLKRYRPSFFVFENVKGLLSFKDSDDRLLLPKMKKEFNEVGYDFKFNIVNTAEFGVPQTRERIIIFGTPIREKKNIDNFFIYLNGQKEQSVDLKTALADMPFLNAGQINNEYTKSENKYISKHYRRDKNIPLTLNIARPNNENDLKIYRLVVNAKNHGKNLTYDELDPKLQTHKHTDKFLDRYKSLSWEKPSYTIVAHIAKDGHHYIHPDINQNRSITVREAARIQGFSDDFYFETSRTEAYKQIGNAVPPILSEKIARAITKIYK